MVANGLQGSGSYQPLISNEPFHGQPFQGSFVMPVCKYAIDCCELWEILFGFDHTYGVWLCAVLNGGATPIAPELCCVTFR